MALLFKPALQISYSVHRRVHLPTQPCFDTLKEARDSLQANIANDHYVHVTFWTALPRSNRPVYESGLDFLPNRLEDLAEYFNYADSLNQDLFEFREYWALTMGLIVNAITVVTTLQESGFGKCGKVTLDTRRLQLKVTCQFAEVPFLIRLENCGGKERLFSWGKEWIKNR